MIAFSLIPRGPNVIFAEINCGASIVTGHSLVVDGGYLL